MSSTMPDLEASRLKIIIPQIDELMKKQHREPLQKMQAATLHRLQLELIEKDFEAYQKQQQEFSVWQQQENKHREKINRFSFNWQATNEGSISTYGDENRIPTYEDGNESSVHKAFASTK